MKNFLIGLRIMWATRPIGASAERRRVRRVSGAEFDRLGRAFNGRPDLRTQWDREGIAR